MPENFQDVFSKDSPGLILGICAACEREQKIDQETYRKQGWDVSHSICPRHGAQMLKIANIPDEKIREKTKNMKTRDLSDSKNKPLVDWMKNPPPFNNKSA